MSAAVSVFASIKYDASMPTSSISDRRQRWRSRVAGHRRRSQGDQPNIDLGLKYRFFNTAKFKFNEDDADR